MPKLSIVRNVVCFILLTVHAIGVLADESLQTAQTLIETGQAQAAYDLLKPMEEERAGDPSFDYLYGLAALDSGHALEAVFALERAIDAAPDSGPARAELARAYLALGDTDDAKEEFSKIKEMELPSDVQRTVDRYLSSIDQYHDASRTRYRPYVSMGIGYDTNVNNATNENQIAVPALGGLVFNLSDASREANSPIWEVAAGVRITTPIDYNRGLSLFVNGDVRHRLVLDENDFTTILANGQVGVNWRRDAKHQFRVSLDGNTARIEGSTTVRSDREVIGTSAQWQYKMDQANQFTVFGQASMVRSPEQRVRDVNRYTGGVGWAHAFLNTSHNPVVFASVFGGIEDEKSESRGAHLGRDFFGVRGGGQISVGTKSTVFGSITYQASDYDGTDPTFLKKRDDDYVDLRGGYRYQLDRHWSVTPTLTYNNNDSNLITSDYDRVEFMLTIQNDF